ncbi:hypothetical protein [Senegalia massiliensis]|uniref:Uncharacterized protein n=1 Tax=Senegalia massiliensis TaxID=1720316 RepID=A0A845R4V1_9CLOT|nr:hypothetical protein [Senegalia massiliensis]NBI07533.1 hypothetical protein [Senegalia massiliensis]
MPWKKKEIFLEYNKTIDELNNMSNEQLYKRMRNIKKYNSDYSFMNTIIIGIILAAYPIWLEIIDEVLRSESDGKIHINLFNIVCFIIMIVIFAIFTYAIKSLILDFVRNRNLENNIKREIEYEIIKEKLKTDSKDMMNNKNDKVDNNYKRFYKKNKIVYVKRKKSPKKRRSKKYHRENYMTRTKRRENSHPN